MERTISVMLGKGSVNHNTRKFKAENVDAKRTHLNISYCDNPIEDVYHFLFDNAVSRYNAKQTRADRKIENYYEKIRTSKQEKLFYEVIFQVGKINDMNARSENGKLAAKILDEFMKKFQERNPNLKVFSAHLHMDEATPHLHVDFVPITTGSKRGLDTRVSLKKALAAQGFSGGTRGDTELNQWVKAEKEELSQVMLRHGIKWEKLGTHEDNLNILNFKKEKRIKEIEELEEKISEKQDNIIKVDKEYEEKQAELDSIEDKLESLKMKENLIEDNARKYDDEPDFQLSPPKSFMSAKSYQEKVVIPLINKFKNAIRGVLLTYIEKVKELKTSLEWVEYENRGLKNSLKSQEKENEKLHIIEKNYKRLRRGLGDYKADEIISEVSALEMYEKKPVVNRRNTI